jgi:hypothetical protein
MAMIVSEIKEWLESLPPGALVGIEEGGLSLQQIGGEAYLEIGGIPEDENVGQPRIEE